MIGRASAMVSAAEPRSCGSCRRPLRLRQGPRAAPRNGRLDSETRRALGKAFSHTSAYDSAIVSWMDGDELLPPTIHLALERTDDVLRYGENPHQRAALYRAHARFADRQERADLVGRCDPQKWDSLVLPEHLRRRRGDAIVYDSATTGRRHRQAREPVRRGGVDDLETAYQRAFECDERSAFGGVVARQPPRGPTTVERMVAAAQADVIVAPGYEDGVVDALAARRKGHAVIEARRRRGSPRHLREVGGGFLVQQAPHFAAARDQWRVVTKAAPTQEQWLDASARMADMRTCPIERRRSRQPRPGRRHRRRPAEPGRGRRDRREEGGGPGAKGGACASDAFYPFPDGVEAAADAGAAVVIQPGGSVNDEQVIETADRLGLAMIFTGERHFLH